MFLPKSAASADLQAHVRYPENLFQIQASQYASYHVTDTAVFFQKQDVWQIPTDPTVAANVPQAGAAAPVTDEMRPYYSLMRLPGASDEHFMLILPFTPLGRQNMVSWMAADSDPGSYGNTVVYTFPSGRNVDGPTQVFAQINQDPVFSAQRTLLGSGGSTVVFGDFLVIPINDSLLYVQPVYVRSHAGELHPRAQAGHRRERRQGRDREQPVRSAGRLDLRSDRRRERRRGWRDARRQHRSNRSQDLLNQALQHFAAADAALTAGDLGTYQSELDQAQALVQQANDLAAQQAGTGGTSGSPTPSPSASASPSP